MAMARLRVMPTRWTLQWCTLPDALVGVRLCLLLVFENAQTLPESTADADAGPGVVVLSPGHDGHDQVHNEAWKIQIMGLFGNYNGSLEL